MDETTVRRAIYARIHELPTLPAVIPRILALVEDPGTSARDLSEAIGHDPALASTVLKVANSAYYGFRREVASLERAVALLGFNMVRSLAASIGVIRSLPPRTPGSVFSREGLWAHSVAVGTAARAMALRADRVDGEALFLAGLLHDVGKVVLDVFFPAEFGRALAVAAGSGEPLHRVERAVLGTDHAEVGGMLLARWNLPEAIRVPVAAHHAAGPPPGACPDALGVLGAADAMARELGLGAAGNPAPPAPAEEVLAAAGLPAGWAGGVRDELSAAREGIEAFAGAMA